MEGESAIISIVVAILTLLLLPIVIDWIKRRWDYISNFNKEKFGVQSELSTLLWTYHGACSRVYGMTYPSIIQGRDKKDIDDDIKVVRAALLEASNNLYNGLYSYQSKVQQYYDRSETIIRRFEELISWAFHDQRNAMDDMFISLTREEFYRHEAKRREAENALVHFRRDADRILQALAEENREGRSFWYPIKRLFR